MREFKNPKAKKLYLESLELDKLADKIEQEEGIQKEKINKE